MDPHYPLPGNIGIDYGQFAEDKCDPDSSVARKTLANAFLETEPEDYRKQLVINQFLDEKFKEEVQETSQVSALFSQNAFDCVY